MSQLARILGTISLLVSVSLSPTYASTEPPQDIKILILKATCIENATTKPILGIKEIGRVEQVNRAWRRAAQQIWKQQAETIFKFSVLPERMYNMASETVNLIMKGGDPAAVRATSAPITTQNYVTYLFKGVICFIHGMKLGLQKPDTQLVCAEFLKYKLLIRYAPTIKEEIILKAQGLVGAFPNQSDPPLMRLVLIAAEFFGDASPLRTYLMKKEADNLHMLPNNPEQCFELKLQVLTRLAEKGSPHAASKLQTLKASGL